MDHLDSFPRPKRPADLPISIGGISPGDAAFSLLEFTFEWFVLALVAQHLFGAKDQTSPLLIVGPAFVAGFIVFYEIRTIVIPSIFARGLAFLKMGGLTIEAVKGSRVRVAAAICIRLVMALGFSTAVVLCISAMFFKVDEDSYNRARLQDRNAALVQRVTGEVDGRIDMKKTALADTLKQAQALSAELATLKRKLNASPRRQDLRDRLAAAEAGYATKDGEVTRLRNDVDSLLAARLDTIGNDVRHSPDYAEAPKGLLSEIKALKTLADSDPTARGVILSFELLFLSLELAVLMSKVVEVTPSAFAGEKVYALYLKAVRLARMAAAETNGDDDTPPPPPVPVTAMTPPANDNGAPAAASPFFGEVVPGATRNGLDEPPAPPRRPRGRPRKGMN